MVPGERGWEAGRCCPKPARCGHSDAQEVPSRGGILINLMKAEVIRSETQGREKKRGFKDLCWTRMQERGGGG